MGISQRIQRNPVLLFAVGCILIVLAIALAALSIHSNRPVAVSQSNVQSSKKETSTIIVAAHEIGRGSIVSADDLASLEVVGNGPQGSISQKSAAIGRVAVTPILPSQIVLSQDLSVDKSAAGISALLRDGTRAISIRISDDQIVGGFLRVGDHVDILATLPGTVFQKNQTLQTGSGADQSRTTLMLQNVEVLAVGTKLATAGPDALKNVQTVTLAVTPQAAARIALVERLGKLTFAIRNPSDDVTTQGTTVGLSDLEGTSNELMAQTGQDATAETGTGRKIVIYSGATVSAITVDR